jgi:hypothetical protein
MIGKQSNITDWLFGFLWKFRNFFPFSVFFSKNFGKEKNLKLFIFQEDTELNETEILVVSVIL